MIIRMFSLFSILLFSSRSPSFSPAVLLWSQFMYFFLVFFFISIIGERGYVGCVGARHSEPISSYQLYR